MTTTQTHTDTHTQTNTHRHIHTTHTHTQYTHNTHTHTQTLIKRKEPHRQRWTSRLPWQNHLHDKKTNKKTTPNQQQPWRGKSLTIEDKPAKRFPWENHLHDQAQEVQDLHATLYWLLVLQLGVTESHNLVHADAFTHQGTELQNQEWAKSSFKKKKSKSWWTSFTLLLFISILITDSI